MILQCKLQCILIARCHVLHPDITLETYLYLKIKTNKLRHINYPNSVHNILVRTFPQHILLSLNPPIRMSSGGGAKLESFSHSPRPSRFTEGSAVLAGLILGTGLDSSLFKKNERVVKFKSKTNLVWIRKQY